MENMPKMEDLTSALPYSLASHATPNFSTQVPVEAPVWPPAARRLQLSSAEWDELKPTIQQLYIEEGRTFNEVAVVLQTNHNFTPTKKMFDDKIKKWGLRKNATRVQRRVILEELRDDEVDKKKAKETSLKLNPAKIERWEREEKLAGTHGKSAAEKGKRAVASTSKAADQRLPDRTLSPLREILEIPDVSPEAVKQPQTIWEMADIPGSPNLSRFHSFLKIAEEFPMPPPLRLSPRDPRFITNNDWSDLVKRPADENRELGEESSRVVVRSSKKCGRSSSPTKLLICEWLLLQIEKPWTPLNEVYPFPISVKARKARDGTYVKTSRAKTRALEIVQGESRLRKMQKTLSPDNPGLIAQMHELAHLYFDAGKYTPAESLYHRVALARQDAFGLFNKDTLEAYLNFLEAKTQKGESLEALTLHQDLHPKIQSLFSPSHDLALQSRYLLGGILKDLDKFKEAEKVYREILQILLHKFGQRHEGTIDAMKLLGDTMRCLDEYAHGEQLLSTALSTALQVTSQDTETFDETTLQLIKLDFGIAVECQGRYKESCGLLKDAIRWLMFECGIQHRETLLGIRRLSRSLRRAGQLEESELLARRNTWRYEHTLGPTHPESLFNIEELAVVMLELNSWTEAADLFEHVFRIRWERNGPDHRYTVWTRVDLDYCYKMQGLYNNRGAFDDKLKRVLEGKPDLANVLNQRRKYGRISGARDDESDEVEEIRPEKKRKTRTMTCTYNLKRRRTDSVSNLESGTLAY